MDPNDHTLDVAREIASIAEAAGFAPILIGAAALAVHNFPRHTEDIDFAVAVEPDRMRALIPLLEAHGWTVEYGAPDFADPLGGVLTVSARDSLPVQIVNFLNPPANGIPALHRSAVLSPVTLPGIKVADLPHLIAFKLYEGGSESARDIVELLIRNDIDLEDVREVCRRFRLERRLKAILPPDLKRNRGRAHKT